MKQLKKWAAVLLALLLVVTLVPGNTFAADPNPTGTILLKGVEKGATVNAYRLTKPFFVNEKFNKYVEVVPTGFADLTKPTDAEWAELIKKPTANFGTAIPLAYDAAKGGFTKSGLGAGLYMVLVKSSEGYVYNPIIFGLSYDTTNGDKVKDAELQVSANFSLSTFYGDNNPIVLYAKKSEVPLTKTVKDNNTDTTHENTSTDTDHVVDLGEKEKADFTINTTIPSYATTDVDPVFTITDTLDKGLTPPAETGITVKVNGQAITPGADTATVKVTGQVIEIKFASQYIKNLNGKEAKVEVTYQATLNDQATRNFDANKNTVVVEYTHDPKTGDTKTTTDITKQYTFDIDGFINGEGKQQTHEITKHYGEITKETTWKDQPLEGATFGLYTDDPSKNTAAKPIQTVDTDKTGRMNFKRLDAGTYYIRETKAPAGYALSDKVFKVVITPTYENNELKSYKIDITDMADQTKVASSTFTNTFKEEDNKGVNDTPNTDTLITNTKIPGLPSTGGMGTYLFTGIGVALLAGAAVVVTVLRKKNAQDAR